MHMYRWYDFLMFGPTHAYNFWESHTRAAALGYHGDDRLWCRGLTK